MADADWTFSKEFARRIDAAVKGAFTPEGRVAAYGNEIVRTFQSGGQLVVRRNGVATNAIPVTGAPTLTGNVVEWPARDVQQAYTVELDVDTGTITAEIVAPDGSKAIPASAGKTTGILRLSADVNPGTRLATIGPIRINIPSFGTSTGGGGTGTGFPVIADAPAPTTCVSSAWGEVARGSARVVNDVWNLSNHGLQLGVGGVYQTVCLGDAVDNANSFRLQANMPQLTVPGVSEVKTYPNAVWGQPPGFPSFGHPNLPIRVGDITVLWAGFKGLVDSGTTGKGHISHDMRLMDTATPIIGYVNAAPHIRVELFVVVKQYQGYGAHPNGRASSRFRGTYNIGGFNWHFYIQPGASTDPNGAPNPQFIWLPATFPLPNPLDMAPLFQWAMTMRYNQLQNGPGTIIEYQRSASDTLINPNEIFVSNAMGFEVEYGTIDVQVNTAYFRVNQDTPGGSGSGGGSGGGTTQCGITLSSTPASITANTPLTYTVSMSQGSCSAFQTWLVSTSGGGATGTGFVSGQGITNTGVGAYSINLAGVTPGNYQIWARCNDASTCQNTFVVRPVTVTAATGGGSSSGVNPVGAGPQARVGALTFRDEFSGSSLNSDKWNPTFDIIASQPTYQELANYAVSGGNLEIWLRPNSDGQYWNWGRTVNSRYKFNQKYGYFECRAKLAYGPGTWPAFWLYSESDIPHPEIDVFEAYAGGVPGTPIGGDESFWNNGAGLPTSYSGTIHFSVPDPYTNDLGSANGFVRYLRSTLYPSGLDLSAAFHTYGALWEPDGVTFFFDGVQMGSKLFTSLLNEEMFLFCSMGSVAPWTSVSPHVTGSSPTSQARALQFDYVRCWALNTGQTTTSGSSSSPTST